MCVCVRACACVWVCMRVHVRSWVRMYRIRGKGRRRYCRGEEWEKEATELRARGLPRRESFLAESFRRSRRFSSSISRDTDPFRYFVIYARLSGNDTVLHVVTACAPSLAPSGVDVPKAPNFHARFSISLLRIHTYFLFSPSAFRWKFRLIGSPSPTLADSFSLVTSPKSGRETEARRKRREKSVKKGGGSVQARPFARLIRNRRK